MTHDSLILASASTAASPTEPVDDGDFGSAFQPIPRRHKRPKTFRNPTKWAAIFGAIAAAMSLLVAAGDHAFAQTAQTPPAAQPIHNCDQ